MGSYDQSTYQPFTKPNTSLQYVHRESNHPPITTKNIPVGINRRLSSLSSDKASFDQTAPPYQKALDESGYHYTLQYEPAKASKRKNRQRNNILWYNQECDARSSSPNTRAAWFLVCQNQSSLLQGCKLAYCSRKERSSGRCSVNDAQVAFITKLYSCKDAGKKTQNQVILVENIVFQSGNAITK